MEEKTESTAETKREEDSATVTVEVLVNPTPEISI
jgi:hypothetical protein